jgi:cytochrome c553
LLLLGLALPAAFAAAPPDTLAQRLKACTACHGEEGREGRDAYYPRIAGKPERYLYNQLVHFRDGRRHYPLMTALIDPLSDDYLREIARHFARQNPPYPPPKRVAVPLATLERGRELVTHGDPAREIPPCSDCHGTDASGGHPAIPGLLGLPRDYINAQLGAWKTGLRATAAPDCMATIVRRLGPEDIAALSAWLASQPVPAGVTPLKRRSAALPMPCGTAQAVAREGTATRGASR